MDTTLSFNKKQSFKLGSMVTWGSGSCRAIVIEEKGDTLKVELTHETESEMGELFPKGTIASIPAKFMRLLS